MNHDWTELDLIELYEERAAIIEYDGQQPRHIAEQQAYWQWRQTVGPGVAAPKKVQEIVRKAKLTR